MEHLAWMPDPAAAALLSKIQHNARDLAAV